MLNNKVKTLLLNACKTCGANVDNILSYIGEQLTIKEYQDAKAFLTWSFTNKKFFGHGNIEERYTQFKDSKKVTQPTVNTRLILTKKELDNTKGSGGLEITIKDCVGNPQEKEPGTAIFLEYYKGQYQVHVWDGTQQDPITIALQKRRLK